MSLTQFLPLFLHYAKFFDIYIAFTVATLLFAFRCKRRPHFWLRWAAVLLGIRLLCLLFAATYGGSLLVESIYSAILLALIVPGLLFCYEEKLSNLLFYFGSGFSTWYIADRVFLIAASLGRLNQNLTPYLTERTLPHMVLYIGCLALTYLIIFFTVRRTMHRLGDSEIPIHNAVLMLVINSALTPIFYFESGSIAQYNLFYYNLLNFGEVLFYTFMLIFQVQLLAAAKERMSFNTMNRLLLEEQKQYRLTKESIDAINIKCHDLKHQIHNLRKTGQVDAAYLDDLERSISIYNSALHTGNEMLDIVLTEKRLHCAAHDIQFTCMADGSGLNFIETADISSLFGNILDNAIECEMKLPAEERFIHLSVRVVNQLLMIHAENRFGDSLKFRNGVPLTTKADKDSHGFGMMSIRHIVEKYSGNFAVSAQDQLFQIDIMLPIPTPAAG